MTSTTHQTSSALLAVDALLQPFNRSDAPGLVVGIAQAGQVLLRRGVGLASVEQGVAMSPRVRVRIASTSKQFTALAVLLLAEEGKLHIDDLIYQHLPELPVLHRDGPTLRQLMQHTGGWRTDLATVAQGMAIEPIADWSQPLSETNRALNFEPGSRMIYSNAGYQLLARVVERLSGLPFDRFLRERIFSPLAMHDTESVTSDLDVRPGMALQYLAVPAAAGGVLRRGIFPGELRGSGSLVSTVDDMLRWLAHLRSPDKVVGQAASWAQMTTTTTLSTGTAVPYAFGLFRHDYRGVEVIHHAGAVLGAGSQMITVPEHALDIMIMTNGAGVSPAALGFQIIDALLADVLGASPEPVQASAHRAVLGHRYHAAETGAVVGFEELAGQLAMGWMGGRSVPLRRQGQAAVLACQDTALNPVTVTLDQLSGSVAPQTITVSDGGHPLRCERLPDVPPGGAMLAQALAGRYLVPDLDASAQLALEGEGAAAQLVIRLQGRQGQSAYRLQPLATSVLMAVPLDPLLAAIGGGGIVTIDRDGDCVTGLWLHTTRLRHLRFERDANARGARDLQPV